MQLNILIPGSDYSDFYLLQRLMVSFAGGKILKFTILGVLVLFQLFLEYANLGGCFWGTLLLTGMFYVSVFKIWHFVTYFNVFMNNYFLFKSMHFPGCSLVNAFVSFPMN